MTRFILIRHGQTFDNQTRTIQGWNDSDLTELGHQQAEKVATALSAEPQLIFTSDLTRCQQTAEHIHRAHPNARLLTDWRLRERSYGNLEGHPNSTVDWDEFRAKHEDESFHGAEPISFFRERLTSFIRSVHEYDIDTVAVVTHSGVLNQFGFLLVDGFERTHYDNTAIVSYDISPDDPRIAPSKVVKWRPYAD